MGDPKLVDIAHTFGVSYRQADYWQRHHYVHTYLAPHDRGEPANRSTTRKPVTDQSGSGYVRHIPPDEVTVFGYLAALCGAGMSPAAAAPVARRLAECPHLPVVFGPVAIGVVGA